VDKTTTNDEDVGELEEEEGTAAKKPRLEE
jgi:hypothetical protein